MRACRLLCPPSLHPSKASTAQAAGATDLQKGEERRLGMVSFAMLLLRVFLVVSGKLYEHERRI